MSEGLVFSYAARANAGDILVKDIYLGTLRRDEAYVLRLFDTNPNVRPSRIGLLDGTTLLHAASAAGLPALVRTCIADGAEIGATNDKGRQPVHFACAAARLEGIRALAEHGVTFGAPITDGTLRSPLHVAGQELDRDAPDVARAVEVLLRDYRADVDATDSGGVTPLMSAVSEGRLSKALVLLAYGADLTLRDAAGDSAADIAARRLRECRAEERGRYESITALFDGRKGGDDAVLRRAGSAA